MEKFDIFRDIAERTGGSIYIGVVGPVRTGKSTFIKRFMDLWCRLISPISMIRKGRDGTSKRGWSNHYDHRAEVRSG